MLGVVPEKKSAFAANVVVGAFLKLGDQFRNLLFFIQYPTEVVERPVEDEKPLETGLVECSLNEDFILIEHERTGPVLAQLVEVELHDFAFVFNFPDKPALLTNKNTIGFVQHLGV